MIDYTPSRTEEYNIRIEYVKSSLYRSLSYSEYVSVNCPGVVKCLITGHDYISSITFDNDKSLVWFKLRYSIL